MAKTYRIELPIRRYAIFSDLLRGDYAVVIRGDDIASAPKWRGFVKWLGGVKPAITITNDRKAVRND